MEEHETFNFRVTRSNRVRLTSELLDFLQVLEVIRIFGSLAQLVRASESVKRWCAEHPSEVPYRKYHSSKESYPEKYFREVLENSKIDFNQEYSVNRYSLDFAFPEKKLYFEVDGKQHENMKEHDAIRTKFLEENGWKLLCRIEWWKFKKLSQDDQKVFCENLIKQING